MLSLALRMKTGPFSLSQYFDYKLNYNNHFTYHNWTTTSLHSQYNQLLFLLIEPPTSIKLLSSILLLQILKIGSSCKDLFSELAVLANLVVGERFKVLLKQTTKLQKCFRVSLLVWPLKHKSQQCYRIQMKNKMEKM